MLDPPLAVRAQEIESYAVPGLVHFLQQLCSELYPVAGGDFAFEDRELHALAVVLTGPGDPPQPPAPCGLGRVHVIAHDNQHCPNAKDTADSRRGLPSYTASTTAPEDAKRAQAARSRRETGGAARRACVPARR